MDQILDKIKATRPLVHHVTNYVTANDCANILLAFGGSPIMADELKEVEEITTISNALVINMGTLNKRTVKTMIRAGKIANQKKIPVVLDPVGVGASAFRTQTAQKLLDTLSFSVIRGNISEIKACNGLGSTKGVDANEEDKITYDTMDEAIALAKSFAKRTGAIVAISGEIDIISDDKKSYLIHNGTKSLGDVCGTGCMSTSLIGGSIGANAERILEATVFAVSTMGLCGELAFQKADPATYGMASFKTSLLDAVSLMTNEQWRAGARIEAR